MFMGLLVGNITVKTNGIDYRVTTDNFPEESTSVLVTSESTIAITVTGFEKKLSVSRMMGNLPST